MRCRVWAVPTLEPPDLRGGPVTLLVASGNAKDDCRLGGVIDVGVGQTGGWHQAGRGGSTVHPHESQLGRTRTGSSCGLAGLDGQVDGVLRDLPRGDHRRLPGELSSVQVLQGQKGVMRETAPTAPAVLVVMERASPC